MTSTTYDKTIAINKYYQMVVRVIAPGYHWERWSLPINVSSDDQGSYPDDLSVSVSFNICMHPGPNPLFFSLD